MSAQNLSQHQWKNRLILLLINDESNLEYHKQLNILQSDKEGIDERKIIVYRIFPDAILGGVKENSRGTVNKELYAKYKKSNSPFEFILLGLDGGEKLRQESCVSLEKLYALIDGMPMRRAEMRRKNE